MNLLKKAKSILGKKIGKLKLIKIIGRKNNRIYCEFECYCGVKKEIKFDSVLNGYTKSCGCLINEMLVKNMKKWRSSEIKKKFGKKFGRWKIISYDSDGKYFCICECGTKRSVYWGRLENGTSKSCGCLSREITKKLMTIHGMKKERFYRIWNGMKNRCLNEKNYSYKKYGGMGIVVCDYWKNFIGFKDDMYEFYINHALKYGEKNTSLNRIDPLLGYNKINCKWDTSVGQTLNRRFRKRKIIRNWELNLIYYLNEKYEISLDQLYELFHINKSDAQDILYEYTKKTSLKSSPLGI